MLLLLSSIITVWGRSIVDLLGESGGSGGIGTITVKLMPFIICLITITVIDVQVETIIIHLEMTSDVTMTVDHQVFRPREVLFSQKSEIERFLVCLKISAGRSFGRTEKILVRAPRSGFLETKSDGPW